MYVPPYESLLRALHTDKTSADKDGKVTIPTSLLKLLLQIAIGNSDFDEELYLKKNPDVKEAVDAQKLENGMAHYIGYGYFEGRQGGVVFDERWYREAYADVTTALNNAQISSAEDHFVAIGGGEGRSPSSEERVNATEWKKSLQL